MPDGSAYGPVPGRPKLGPPPHPGAPPAAALPGSPPYSYSVGVHAAT